MSTDRYSPISISYPLRAHLYKCVSTFPVTSPPPAFSTQVWAALTLVTDIRNAVVTIRLLHLTGTAAACKALTQQCDDRGLQGLKLTRPQAQAVEDAKERLSHMEV